MDPNSQDTSKYLRLLRLQRLYKLMRLFRVVKLVKTHQFGGYILDFVEKFKVGVTTSRILKLFVFAFLCTHIFSCIFYFSATMYDFADNTWVS